MNTLNWEKLPTFKVNKTLWSGQGASLSLQGMLGEGKALSLDVDKLEGMFAKPATKARTVGGATSEAAAPKSSKVQLLEAKRSTSVGIAMKRITDGLQGKELRDALMEVDENVLPLEVIPMVIEIVPTADEKRQLLEYTGDLSTLDKPEQLLRSLAHIPRLEARLKAMAFKAQLELDMDGVLMQQIDDLKAACELVRDSKELHALMAIVLDVGNALNAGTAKGNAVGFKLSTLLKLAELKAADKKTTLLHFVVDVVQQSVPQIARICEAQKAVRDASRISLDELEIKRLDAERGLAHVDAEITWHDEQRLRGGPEASPAGEEDMFPEVFTEFYNWAAEKKETFDEELLAVRSLFSHAKDLMGESDVKEPTDLFDTLDKFLRRFEVVQREVEEARKAAEEASANPTKGNAPAAAAPRRGRGSVALAGGTAVPGGPKLLKIKPKGSSASLAEAPGGAGSGAADAGAEPGAADSLPQRRMSSAKRASTSAFDAINSLTSRGKR